MRISSFITSAVMLLTAASSLAQTVETRQGSLITPERTEFRPHWSMQLQAGAGYTIGENDKFTDLLSPTAAINFGYTFTPAFTLRFGASGWQGRGVWASPYSKYKFNYLQGNVDAVLSFTDLFRGFRPDRRFNFYGFLGIGGNYAFHNNEAESLAAEGMNFQKLWRGHRWGIAGRGGLGMNIWVSPKVAVNVEANANMLPDNFNSKRGSHFDWQYNLLAGVTIRFGKNTRTIPAVYEQLPVTRPEPVRQPEPEPVQEPAPAPAPVVEKVQPLQQDIFFTINSAVVRKAEAEKITALVDYMTAHPDAKVVITGYADKATGTPRYNMTLSQRRAEAVAATLTKSGIADSRISIAAKGDTQQPFDINDRNRVVIAVAE